MQLPEADCSTYRIPRRDLYGRSRLVFWRVLDGAGSAGNSFRDAHHQGGKPAALAPLVARSVTNDRYLNILNGGICLHLKIHIIEKIKDAP